MQITVLAGGIGGARFVSGLRAAFGSDVVTVIANTADDIDLFGLHISPDLDSLMYTLGGGIDTERGWGRSDEGWRVREELRSYDEPNDWFGLGDRDLATHLLRTSWLRAGIPLHEVTRRLCQRWKPGVRLLPMTNDSVQTYVHLSDGVVVHFQEWWIRLGAGQAARSFEMRGAEASHPAPGVLEAIATADVVLLAPSNPVVSISTILAVPGIRAALQRAAAPVVGVSPIIGGAPVRGMADACLPVVGVPTSAAGVAHYYGSRSQNGLLDGWLVAEEDDDCAPELAQLGLRVQARPLLMTDDAASADIGRAAVGLARQSGDRTRLPDDGYHDGEDGTPR